MPVRWILQLCVCLPHQVSADLWQDGDWGYLSDSLVLSISMHMSSRRQDPVFSSPSRLQFYSGLSFPCFPPVSGPCRREQAPVTALLSLHCGPQPETFLKAEPSSSNCSPYFRSLSFILLFTRCLALAHSFPLPSTSSLLSEPVHMQNIYSHSHTSSLCFVLFF